MIFAFEPVGGGDMSVAWEVIVGIPLIIICAGAALTITMYRMCFAKVRDESHASVDGQAFRPILEELRGDPREIVGAARD